jgi:hypothetical protein
MEIDDAEVGKVRIVEQSIQTKERIKELEEKVSDILVL